MHVFLWLYKNDELRCYTTNVLLFFNLHVSTKTFFISVLSDSLAKLKRNISQSVHFFKICGLLSRLN